MDGSVRSFKPELDAKVLKILIERADGQPLPDLTNWEPQFALTKEELTLLQKVLKEDEKILEAIGEQLREHQKLLGELAQRPDLADLQLGKGIGFPMWGDPSLLTNVLEEMKKNNKELRKAAEGKKK
jgi:hypothetical protein